MSDRIERETLVREVYAARDTESVEGIMKFFDPECVFRIAGSARLRPFTSEIRGQDALARMMGDLRDNWGLSGLTIEAMYVDGDTVIARRAGAARYIPNGNDYPTELVDIFTFRDGLIVSLVEFVDTFLVADIAGGF